MALRPPPHSRAKAKRAAVERAVRERVVKTARMEKAARVVRTVGVTRVVKVVRMVRVVRVVQAVARVRAVLYGSGVRCAPRSVKYTIHKSESMIYFNTRQRDANTAPTRVWDGP